MTDDIVADLRRMADARVYSIRKRMHEAADEIERLRNALKDERELRLNAETRAMARIADIDIRDAHIRYLKSAITNKEEQQ